jgi:hypothetical protein
MIGFQWLAIELENGNFLCGKFNMLSIQLSMGKAWEDKNVVKELIECFETFPELNTNVKDDNEMIFTYQELQDIKNSSNCISPEYDGYHKHASDGIIVIPLSKEKCVPFNNFKPTK